MILKHNNFMLSAFFVHPLQQLTILEKMTVAKNPF